MVLSILFVGSSFPSSRTNPGGGNVNPKFLLSQLCRKAPRFKGYQQHDSHELLRALLDGMENEERDEAMEVLLTHFGVGAVK